MLTFYITQYIPDEGKFSSACSLSKDNWDDWGFKTAFYLCYFDKDGKKYNIGQVKIGKYGMTSGWITEFLGTSFASLEKDYFSLGQGEEYYEALQGLPEDIRKEILIGLKDIAFDELLYDYVKSQDVITTSLMRGISEETVVRQYRRMSRGGAKLVSYSFSFSSDSEAGNNLGISNLRFNVVPESTPPSNVHVIIGRNGVGKTTLLKKIKGCLTTNEVGDGRITFSTFNESTFANIVYVSFSAFDDILPEVGSPTSNIKYAYVGLKKVSLTDTIESKSLAELTEEFGNVFSNCQGVKKKRIIRALTTLSSDPLFKEYRLLDLVEGLEQTEGTLLDRAKEKFSSLSSGHKIVLLTVTQLVDKVEEKTLILFDEPEAHLHPPLLSSLIRAISDLVIDRNGVAIIATHSPVVLQEVPSSCVWILQRIIHGSAPDAMRPAIETFGESVGSLTREVFGLEVTDTGFNKLIEQNIEEGDQYEDVLRRFNNKMGGEAKALVRLTLTRRTTD